jgi:hypothetical protein
VAEAFVQLGDASRPALVKVRQNVRLRLGDVEAGIGRERQRDGMCRTVEPRDEG